MTGPPIIACLLHHPSLDRIDVDVPDCLEKIPLAIHDPRAIASPEQRAIEPVQAAESLRVDPVDVPHCPAQQPTDILQQQIVMVTNQAGGMAAHIPALCRLLYQVQKAYIVVITDENLPASLCPVHHVVLD